MTYAGYFVSENSSITRGPRGVYICHLASSGLSRAANPSHVFGRSRRVLHRLGAHLP